MQADDPQLTAEHDGVVVTVVSTTWRAAIVEVRSGDDVRWVTVPRHELAGFMAAAGSGAMGVALRHVLSASGAHAASDVDSEFGVFDTMPDEETLLAPERDVLTGGYRPSGTSQRSKEQRAQGRSPRRISPRVLGVAVVAVAAAVAAGVVVSQALSGDSPKQSATAVAVSVGSEPVTTVAAAPTVVPTTVPLLPSLTLPVLVSQLVQPVAVIAATSLEAFDADGITSDFGEDTGLGFVVECTTSCVLRFTSILSAKIADEMPIIDGAAVGDVVVQEFSSPQCPPEWTLVFGVDLRFGFAASSVVPTSASGTVTATSPLIEVDRSTSCSGLSGLWDVDTELIPVAP